ncbi:SDR family oxidoreductase [Actinocatenispora comari]|uniref:7-alpha-hydroxysteroid dehydrogenase n=1 Tax=Actinocatenispora comari TaxID=2807577 RepID=A0A8J4A9D0_9ACTN|nr:SDR family oxidoreductase [Actinocatenispora comari]GIL27181.1 7-alpha-hydroxysteroid dehydrogenase [Actinocatenispora comari]
MSEFADTVTVITGASRGIGRSLALSLAAAGGTVVINYKRNTEAAQKTLAEVEALGGKGITVAADVEEPDDIDRLFDVVESTYGTIHHFVSNAAASSFKPIMELKAHNLDRSYAMNVRALVLGAQRAVPLMTGGGRIVTLSSYGSIRAYPSYANLGSAKAAIEAWVRYMAVEFAQYGINVNAVNGGIIESDSSAYFYDVPGMPALDDVLRLVPQRRMGSVKEMSDVVLFLLSAASGYITGQSIVVDGGLSTIAPPFHADTAPPLRLPEVPPAAPTRRETDG